MPAQFLENAHRDRVCVCVHRGECMHVCMSACVCTVLKKANLYFFPVAGPRAPMCQPLFSLNQHEDLTLSLPRGPMMVGLNKLPSETTMVG
uniref:Uncharacterized protein n=1 Tax=Aegilops tauschii subsp. strangulata TaxID=200361 RepID=A0A452XW23_AEGTS